MFHKILSNEIVSASHDKSYGTFFVLKSPIISILDKSTTEMIEPKIYVHQLDKLKEKNDHQVKSIFQNLKFDGWKTGEDSETLDIPIG